MTPPGTSTNPPPTRKPQQATGRLAFRVTSRPRRRAATLGIFSRFSVQSGAMRSWSTTQIRSAGNPDRSSRPAAMRMRGGVGATGKSCVARSGSRWPKAMRATICQTHCEVGIFDNLLRQQQQSVRRVSITVRNQARSAPLRSVHAKRAYFPISSPRARRFPKKEKNRKELGGAEAASSLSHPGEVQ